MLNDTFELARVLIQLGNKAASKSELFYGPAFQLGLDMLTRLRMHNEVVAVLIEEDYVMRGLDYAYENNVTGMKMKAIRENVELAKKDGDDLKAQMLANRLATMKQVSLFGFSNTLLFVA